MSSIQDISDELSTKLNEIRLSKHHPLTKHKVFVLLEGKTDIKLFRNIFNNQAININQINGKEKIIKALQMLQGEGFIKIFGIKDSDFDNLENITYEDINLFITDYADMEIQMIESQAFESLLNEFSDDNCHEIFLENLKEKLYKETIIIGYLRWYNEIYFKENNEYLLRFKGLNFSNFTNALVCDVSINSDDVLNEIIKLSNLDLNNSDLEEIIKSLELSSNNHLQICNGHDITTVLANLFNHKNNSDKSNINQNRIEEALRLSYTFEDFTNTNLYSTLKEWQETLGLQVFKI